MKTNTRPPVLTVTEAGLLLGVSRSTAYELVRSGELRSSRRRCVVNFRPPLTVPVAVVAEQLGVTVDDTWAPTTNTLAASNTPMGTREADRPVQRSADFK